MKSIVEAIYEYNAKEITFQDLLILAIEYEKRNQDLENELHNAYKRINNS
jgi:hypothetical protein